MSFTHLQVRSGYSFMQSTVQIEPLVQRAKELQYTALALTDEGVLYEAIPFYQACVARQIKPIFGMTLTFTYQDELVDAIVLAKSTEGYKQLIHISTRLQLNELHLFHDVFEQTKELIVIILAKTPVIRTYLHDEQVQELDQWLQGIKVMFQPENVYIGLERLSPLDDALITQAKQFTEETGIKGVALHDVRYVEEKEALSYSCLRAIDEGRQWTETQDTSRYEGYHLRSVQEMAEAFQGWQEALETSGHIADQCNVTFSFDDVHLPTFPVPTGETAATYLKKQCERGLEERYHENNRTAARQRLDDELQIITELGFDDYFLIVADFVQFAKDEGITVGPGRGSAAGSIVAYLLHITDVDPLAHNLLFERFLNPERINLPDIDIDFSDNRRDEVIAYVRERYGDAYVAQIITFGTFAARSILREVMKVMNIDENDQTYILRHIPKESSQRIADSVRPEKELVKYIKQSKKLTTLFQIAIQLEGLPRHMSVHAAGIVIGKRPLIEDVPLTKGTHETAITQYAMHELEAIGLLKMDILGLRNLSLIERIKTSIQRYEDESFSLNAIDQSDSNTFTLLQRGQTNGIFQFESAGMKRMLTKVKPNSLDDLIALNALYRPGPMEHIPTYTRRKHGEEPVTYLHDDLRPILEETYGVLVYQEQIMQIAHRFASFSLGEADLLRRAISHKDRAQMDSLHERFLQGCLQNGYQAQVAEELFRWIVTFADYGFNKSHSVAYSKVAYTLAYLKANYPEYFFAQLLNASLSGEHQKRITYMREAKDLGISILPPSINYSFAYFTVENKAIRMGLLALKGIGYETAKTIINARQEKPFQHLFDFVLRVNLRRNVLETLILAGAFDETHSNRASVLASITPALERAELFGGYGEGALFKDSLEMKASYVEVEDFPLMEKLAEEREIIGTYMSTHPLKESREALTASKYMSIRAIKRLRKGSLCRVVAYAQRVKKIRTRRGDSMAFVTLSDETDEIEAVVFSNVWRHAQQWLEEDQLFRINGRASERKGEKQLIINEVEPYALEKLQQSPARTIYIRIQHHDRQKTLTFLKEIARQFPGDTKVIVYDARTKESFKLSNAYALFCEDLCLQQLNEYFGTENVVLK